MTFQGREQISEWPTRDSNKGCSPFFKFSFAVNFCLTPIFSRGIFSWTLLIFKDVGAKAMLSKFLRKLIYAFLSFGLAIETIGADKQYNDNHQKSGVDYFIISR